MRIFSLTAVRDEGPFLLEWLAWHRVLGVTDFLIFSNDCRDGTDRLLEALAAEGIVEHRENHPPPGKSIQWNALKQGWRHPVRKATDWMLFSDVDEFPMIHVGGHRFADLFAALPEDAEAVAMAWRLFGSSGIVHFVDEPVTAQFLHCAPEDMCHPVAATMFKSLFRPAAFQKAGVHRPSRGPNAGPAAWYDGSGRPLTGYVREHDKRLSLWPMIGHRALVELNHYSLRSLESYVVKSERGLPNRSEKNIDLSYWVQRNFNNVRNEAALALQASLRKEITFLRRLPGVAEAHEAACAWHRARVAQLLRQPDYYRLYTDCLHAENSRALDREAARMLYAMYQELEHDAGITSGEITAGGMAAGDMAGGDMAGGGA